MNKSKVFVFKEKIVCYALVFMCIMMITMLTSAMQDSSELRATIRRDTESQGTAFAFDSIRVLTDNDIIGLAKERTESGTILHDLANRTKKYRSESQENLRQIVALLKNKGQINLDALDDQGRTALDIAQQNNQPILIAVLKERGAHFNKTFESTTRALETSPPAPSVKRRRPRSRISFLDFINKNLGAGRLDRMLTRIQQASDDAIKDLARERAEGGTILHEFAHRKAQYNNASQETLEKIVDILINRGEINLDALDNQGRTALDIAQQNNQPIMAAVLREAQFNRPLESTTCALETNPQEPPVKRRRRRSDISFLALINNMLNYGHLSRMLDQMKQASDDDIKELTRERAAGGTILHDIANRKAQYKNHSQENLREIVALLKNRGNINFDARDDQGRTALDIARQNNQPVLAAVLKERGAHFSLQVQPTTHTVSFGQQVPSVGLPGTTFSEGVVGDEGVRLLPEEFYIEGQEQQPVFPRGTKRGISFEDLEKELLGQQGETLPEEEQRSKKRQRTGNPARVDFITID